MTKNRTERVQRILETLDEMSEEEARSLVGACAAIYLRTARDEGHLAMAVAAATELDGVVLFWTKDSVARVEGGSRDDAAKATEHAVDEISRTVKEALPRIGHNWSYQ